MTWYLAWLSQDKPGISSCRKLKIDSKCCHLFSYNFISNIAILKLFCIFVISNNKSFIFQNLKVAGPLGGKFDFFSPSGFEIQSDFD